MKKFNVLILLLIFFSCLSVSFAANEDSNSTLSTDTNHVTELTDNNDNIQQFMKTDSEVETANNKQAVSNESIAKTATTTSTNHTYVRPKSYVLLNASVKDANNKVVNEGQVYFKINNSILKDTNNKTILANVNKGFAQVKYYVGLTPTDDYNLTAIFKGSANYKMSTADNIFTVHKNKTNLRVFINPSSVVSGKKMNLTAIITREDNVTVNGGKVAFKLNENTIRDNKGNPIYARLVSGKATIETSIPVGTSAKEYYLMATYSGTTDNEETKSYSEGTRTYNEIFYVLKDDVNVVLSPYNNTVEWGEKINIHGQILTSDNRTTTREHKVTVKLNGNTKLEFRASSNDFNFTLDTGDLYNKEYNLTIIIGENGAFNGKVLDSKIFITHYYDKYINISKYMGFNHIIMGIDNSSYDIKNYTTTQPSEVVLNGTQVVIEDNIVKLKFNGTENHNVSIINYYDDIIDLSNVTVGDNEYLTLFVETEPLDLTNIPFKKYNIFMGPADVSVVDKIVYIYYNRDGKHNIYVNKEVIVRTQSKIIDFVGGKSS